MQPCLQSDPLSFLFFIFSKNYLDGKGHFSLKNMHLLLFKTWNYSAWDERGIAIPLMDQNERTVVTGIFFGHLKVNCSVKTPVHLLYATLYYVINKSHVLAYSVGFRMNPVDWLEGNRRIQQLSVVKILSDLRRTIEMLTARICMDFVWTPRLLFVTLLASLDYRSVTEAKYLWGLCMSVTSVCFTPVCLLNYDRLEAIL